MLFAGVMAVGREFLTQRGTKSEGTGCIEAQRLFGVVGCATRAGVMAGGLELGVPAADHRVAR